MAGDEDKLDIVSEGRVEVHETQTLFRLLASKSANGGAFSFACSLSAAACSALHGLNDEVVPASKQE
jgi:hypothetical protein